MKRVATLLGLTALLAASPVALADEAEAESCLRTKIWDGYNEGWAVRTATSATLAKLARAQSRKRWVVSGFERPSAASDLAWERLAGDIEKVQDDAAIHYAKYEGAKRAAADRAAAQGKPAAVEKNEEGLKGWNETTDGPRPATAEPAPPLPTTDMYEEARKRYEVFTGHPADHAGRRRHTPKSADAKKCICR